MDFLEAEQYLLNIPRFTSKNEPEKTKAFLEEIGDFSLHIPTVHVAGTNGKGSVCAYLRAGLEANGLKVGLFTSPHLVSIRERFMIGDEMISEREFVNVFNYVYETIEKVRAKEGFCGYHPTFFEFLFFMADVWFKTKRPDVVILETGLGGRLDATNSIENPKVCVITEIGLDHCEYLGNTKEEIAFEKAGIIKPGVPLVHWSKEEPFDEVILKRAKELNSEAHFVSKKNIKNLETLPSGIDFSMQSLYDEFVDFSLNTRALYQVENAAISFETLMLLSKELPGKIELSKCVEGFKCMHWPARMEVLSENLYLDGAHNEDGIKAFLESVSLDKSTDKCLLFSAVSDKNIEMVSNLIKESRLFRKVIICSLSTQRAADIERLKTAFFGIGELSLCKDVREGFGELMREREKGASAYIAGSLYLAGEVLTLIEKEGINND